jgi:hypothetical protein
MNMFLPYTQHFSKNFPFFAHKEFLYDPYSNLVQPPYAEASIQCMASVIAPPSSFYSPIFDINVLGYIDDEVSS